MPKILGNGEQEAIWLAYDLEATLLIDDLMGRSVARMLGLQVTGTIGVLLAAKSKGIVTEILPLLREIRSNGYWLADSLLADAARLANEQFP